jgi:hypothetical protein
MLTCATLSAEAAMGRSEPIPNYVALSRELSVLSEALSPGEQVIMEVRASWPWAGLLALTTHGLLFIRWRVILKGFLHKRVSWQDVLGVSEEPNRRGVTLLVTVARKKRPHRLEFFFDKDRAPAVAREIRARMGRGYTS